MGIVPSTFKQATCTRLLLWFASLLLLSFMELMAMLALLVPMELIHMLLPMELTHMPMVDTVVLADMLPTLPELSMLPRDLLMLSQRLMLMLPFSMEPTDMVDMVLDMPDTDMELTHMPMVDMDTHMPMELTTERDLLMLSQR